MKKVKVMNVAQSSVVKRCNCFSPFQDVRYGKNKRVHNALGNGRFNSVKAGVRCTVCGKENQ